MDAVTPRSLLAVVLFLVATLSCAAPEPESTAPTPEQRAQAGREAQKIRELLTYTEGSITRTEFRQRWDFTGSPRLGIAGISSSLGVSTIYAIGRQSEAGESTAAQRRQSLAQMEERILAGNDAKSATPELVLAVLIFVDEELVSVEFR